MGPETSALVAAGRIHKTLSISSLSSSGSWPYLDNDERTWWRLAIDRRSLSAAVLTIRRWCSLRLHLLRLKCSQPAWDPVELELPLRMAVVA